MTLTHYKWPSFIKISKLKLTNHISYTDGYFTFSLFSDFGAFTSHYVLFRLESTHYHFEKKWEIYEAMSFFKFYSTFC